LIERSRSRSVANPAAAFASAGPTCPCSLPATAPRQKRADVAPSGNSGPSGPGGAGTPVTTGSTTGVAVVTAPVVTPVITPVPVYDPPIRVRTGDDPPKKRGGDGPGHTTGGDKPSGDKSSGNDRPGRTTGGDKPSKWNDKPSHSIGQATSTKTFKPTGSTGYGRSFTMNRSFTMSRPMSMGPRPMFRTGGFSMGRRFF
jgi:hypothetical protein